MPLLRFRAGRADEAAMWGRRRRYDRARCLAEAARAQRKGKLRKAERWYREILGVEPGDAEVHRRLAPVLAQRGRREAAWESYRRAADALRERGFEERAIGVYREAAGRIPREPGVWLALADLEVGRGRRPDALRALASGRRELCARSRRRDAIRLLERARELVPADFDVGLDLARLLARVGERARALAVLDALADGAEGRSLRRVRACQLNLAPGLGSTWRWLRSLGT